MPETKPVPSASAALTDVTAYANPAPIANEAAERESLTTRIANARGMVILATGANDSRTAARWVEATDTLLDHLLDIERRLRTAHYDQVALGMGVDRGSRSE